jgi:hypothetical protein
LIRKMILPLEHNLEMLIRQTDAALVWEWGSKESRELSVLWLWYAWLVVSLTEVKNGNGESILDILNFHAPGRFKWKCLVSKEYLGLGLRWEVTAREQWVRKFAWD